MRNQAHHIVRNYPSYSELSQPGTGHKRTLPDGLPGAPSARQGAKFTETRSGDTAKLRRVSNRSPGAART